MENIQMRVQTLVAFIRNACNVCGLDITILDDKIGFVDREEKKIVAAWAPEYKVTDTTEKKEEVAE